MAPPQTTKNIQYVQSLYPHSYEVSILIPILQKRKLRPREAVIGHLKLDRY